MLKIVRDQWDRNKDNLKQELSNRLGLNYCSYLDLVKLSFECVYNKHLPYEISPIDIYRIHEIDDGDYQGTYLYVIPFATYEPTEYEYLMTYVGYGSCSGCDTLQSIQEYGDGNLTKGQIKEFMKLCKDILCNTIRPYNNGWRNIPEFDSVEGS